MIELHDFSIGYGERTLLNEVETTIEKGKLTALIGRNGTGKSTLLRAIAGLNRRYAGRILLDGRLAADMRAPEMARTLAFVTTERTRIANLKCEDVVAIGRAPYTNWIGRMQEADKEIVMRSLASVGMEAYAERTMPAHHDRTGVGAGYVDYSARRTHLVPRYAQPLRIVYAAGTAGARRREMYPLFYPRTRYRPLARRCDSPYRPAPTGTLAHR